MSPLILGALAFVIVFVLYMFLVNIFSDDKSKSDSLNLFDQDSGDYNDMLGDDIGDPVELEQPKSGSARFYEGIMRALGINVDSSMRSYKKKALHAGITSPDAPVMILFFKIIIGPVLGVIGVIMLGSTVLKHGINFDFLDALLGLILIVLGFFGADLYVKNNTQKRQQVLLRSFPDALDLIVVCVESGLALDAALARVCKELGRAHPEITKELNQTRVELALLNDRPRALMNLADRVDLVPFRSLVAALIQTEKFGTSLSDTLRVLSEDYRLTRLMMAEQKAGRLPVMMTIPLIGLLLPAFVIIILGPPIIRVMEQGGLFGNG